MKFKNPRTGTGVLIFNNKNQLLMIRRNNKHAAGKGSWSSP